MTGIGANSPLARAPATARLPPHSGTSKYAPLGQGFGYSRTPALRRERGELGEGRGSERTSALSGCPFYHDGAEPRHHSIGPVAGVSEQGETLPDRASVRGRTRMPASRSPRCSHSDSGHASIPARSIEPDHSAKRAISGPGSLGTFALPKHRAVAIDNARCRFASEPGSDYPS